MIEVVGGPDAVEYLNDPENNFKDANGEDDNDNEEGTWEITQNK